MKLYNGIELGPLLEEDAALLQGAILMTDPQQVVEFGFLRGHSARIMLEVMSEKATLTSYDNTTVSNIPNDPRFTLVRRGQEDYLPTPGVDFVFLDASHDLELNQKTWKLLQGALSETAIVAVHDTGAWFDNVFDFNLGYATDAGYLHCPDERKFMNWIKKEYPDWQQIHFGTTRRINHGITLLQKYYPLSV